MQHLGETEQSVFSGTGPLRSVHFVSFLTYCKLTRAAGWAMRCHKAYVCCDAQRKVLLRCTQWSWSDGSLLLQCVICTMGHLCCLIECVCVCVCVCACVCKWVRERQEMPHNPWINGWSIWDCLFLFPLTSCPCGLLCRGLLSCVVSVRCYDSILPSWHLLIERPLMWQWETFETAGYISWWSDISLSVRHRNPYTRWTCCGREENNSFLSNCCWVSLGRDT